MNPMESSQPDSSTSSPEGRPRNVIFGVCLGLSLAIHIVTIVIVVVTSVQRNRGPAVTYIDIDSIAGAVAPATPVIQSPPPSVETVTPDQPVTLPETGPASAPAAPPGAPAPTSIPELLTTSLGRGMTSGYFSSLADGRNLRDDIREYYFVLLEKINSRWWQKAETFKDIAWQDGIAEFLISRDGTLYDLRVSKSTGSREVDRAIMDVLKEMAPFPPLPDSYAPNMFQAPLRIAAPLHLFSVRSIR